MRTDHLWRIAPAVCTTRLSTAVSCTLSNVDGGRDTPNQERPVQLVSFGAKRLFCTKLVAVISLAMPFPGGGCFQASSAECTFEHLALRHSLWDATLWRWDIAQERCRKRSIIGGDVDSREVLIRNGGNSGSQV